MSTRLSTSSFLPAACSFAYWLPFQRAPLHHPTQQRRAYTRGARCLRASSASLLSHYRGSEKPDGRPALFWAQEDMTRTLHGSEGCQAVCLTNFLCPYDWHRKSSATNHVARASMFEASLWLMMGQHIERKPRKVAHAKDHDIPGLLFVCGTQRSASVRVSSYWPSPDVSSGLKLHERSAGKPVCIDLWKPALRNSELKTGISEKCILLHRLAEECTFTLKK